MRKKITFWLILLIILSIVGYLIYTQTTLFYPKITKIIFEEDNVSTEPFNDFLLKTKEIAKEWSPDAELKFMRFTKQKDGDYGTYQILFISQSKKIETSMGPEPGVLEFAYNCKIKTEKNETLKIKGYGCEPKFNNKLTAVFCYKGDTCLHLSSELESINIENIKISGMDAYKKTNQESRMARLINKNGNFYWKFNNDYIDAEIGEMVLEKQKNFNIDNTENDKENENEESKSSQDFDNDGLTYDEEIKLGTSPINPDSDGDGYTDGEEVKNGYDPLTDAVDIENNNHVDDNASTKEFKEYKNEFFNCSFNYFPPWYIDDQSPGSIAIKNKNKPFSSISINSFLSYIGGNKSLTERLDNFLKARYNNYEILDYSENKNIQIKKVITYSDKSNQKDVFLFFYALENRIVQISWAGIDLEDEDVKTIISSIKLIKN